MTHDDRDVERVADAIRLSQARDDEGQFAALGDLLGFSGENAARTVCREAARAALSAMPHAALLREAMEALIEAHDCIASWGGYASSYFQEKHDLEGDLARARAAAQRLRDALTQENQP